MKDLTVFDAERFWQYLAKEHPEINGQLSNFAFVGQTIVSFQPAKMSNEDYATYNRIKDEWLKDNGFL